MKILFKLIKYLFFLLLLLVLLSYLTLFPKPYKTDIKISQQPAQAVNKRTLKIITFNLGLLDIRILGRTMFKPTDFIQQRAKVIPQHLLARNADVIALQEIYEKRDIDYFIQELKAVYPYYYFKHPSRIKLNNGLMVFSKFPFVDMTGQSQQEKGPIDEWFIADRGLLSTTIQVNDKTLINLVNLHATSGGTLNKQDSDKMNFMRQTQMEQALKLALSGNTEYQIIVGDINAGPDISPMNYKYLLENDFTDAYDAYSKRSGIAVKPTWYGANPLNAMRGYTSNDAQRIDHIYLSKRLSMNSTIVSAERIFDENMVTVNGKAYPLSDHYGVEVVLQLH